MGLCDNRPEGFGPSSSIHPSVPTTCFDDTILIPLPTWIFLAALPVVIATRALGRPGRAEGKTRTTIGAKILMVLYYFLLVAMVAMVSLQMARLSKAELGVGLLWFTFIGVVESGLLQWLARPIWVRILTAFYWGLLAIMMGVEVAGLRRQEGALYNRVGTQMNYPLGDEVTDMSVMVGVAVILMTLEVGQIFGFPHHRGI